MSSVTRPARDSGDWEMECQTPEGFLQIIAVCLVEPHARRKSATDIATAQDNRLKDHTSDAIKQW